MGWNSLHHLKLRQGAFEPQLHMLKLGKEEFIALGQSEFWQTYPIVVQWPNVFVSTFHPPALGSNPEHNISFRKWKIGERLARIWKLILCCELVFVQKNNVTYNYRLPT